MKEKTKILAVGDVHEDSSLVKKISEIVEKEKIGLVIFAGDITLGERSTKNIVGPIIKSGARVLLVPGNHESVATIDFLSKAYPNTKNIHGYGFSESNIGIFGVGGADFGIHRVSEEEIFELLKKGYNEIKNSKKKIMVTHFHPHKSKSEIFGFKGSKAIRKAIEEFKPDIAIHAHIHEAGGIEEKMGNTSVINVSRKPKIFEI